MAKWIQLRCVRGPTCGVSSSDPRPCFLLPQTIAAFCRLHSPGPLFSTLADFLVCPASPLQSAASLKYESSQTPPLVTPICVCLLLSRRCQVQPLDLVLLLSSAVSRTPTISTRVLAYITVSPRTPLVLFFPSCFALFTFFYLKQACLFSPSTVLSEGYFSPKPWVTPT